MGSRWKNAFIAQYENIHQKMKGREFPDDERWLRGQSYWGTAAVFWFPGSWKWR
jgi:hypothetical protein